MKTKKILTLFALVALFVSSFSGCTRNDEAIVPSVPNQAVASEPLPTAFSSDGADAESQNVLSGQIMIQGQLEPITLQYCKGTGEECFFVISALGKQQEYPLRDDFRLDTVDFGFSIQDVNQDGQDDLFIDLGIYGRAKMMACLIYDQEQGFLEVEGFRDLMLPHWVESTRMVVDKFHTGSEFQIDHYCIQGTRLVLIESLLWSYQTGSPVYTIVRYINGASDRQETAIREADIDFDYWDQP